MRAGDWMVVFLFVLGCGLFGVIGYHLGASRAEGACDMVTPAKSSPITGVVASRRKKLKPVYISEAEQARREALLPPKMTDSEG